MADIQRFAPPRDGRPFPPLSVAVRHGQTLYVSGIGPFAPDGTLAAGDFAAQFAEVIASLHAILAAAGTDITRVVKTNVLLTRAGDVPEMNRLYAAAFPAAHLPARTTCVVAALPVADFLLEIECVVALA
ncbi:MAG: enamine deaminase RidA [Belnapia sp.]|jgi:2-iminobutanoate/2-iminopropanoate deaminase|nr:enamine deaminase RidA [Belnapia sp.]